MELSTFCFAKFSPIRTPGTCTRIFVITGIFRIDQLTSSFNASVQQFAHRDFPRLLIAIVSATRVQKAGDIVIPLMLNMGEPSRDFNMTENQMNSGYTYLPSFLSSSVLV